MYSFGYTYQCVECRYVGPDIHDHVITHHREALRTRNLFELIRIVRFRDVVVKTKPRDPEFLNL